MYEVEAADRSEGGFALIVALLSLVGLTALATAGFLVADADYDVAQNHRAAVRAFYVADAGLKEFVATQRGTPDDTVFFNYPQGVAMVTSTLLNRPALGTEVYLIDSQGTYTPPEGGVAMRNVSTITILDVTPIGVPAALTSLSGIDKNGIAGEINGFDESKPGECPGGGATDVPGVAVPPGGYGQTGGGGKAVPQGDPPILEDTPANIAKTAKIPWVSVSNGTAMLPDYILPGDAWPNFGALSSDDWPVILVDQAAEYEVTPIHSGRGTLIVVNDLRMNGAWNWDGIVLIGGNLISDGNQTVNGATIAGLNVMKGQTPNAVDIGNGTKIFRYNSCNVLNALNGLAMQAEEPGTWFESF